ncbi:sulfatase-like hydrolase/transferase [Pricia antarctica]|uniref:sulfatase-like hydrolase/transferase n=1 Tax=Pricia antarctica TaxID=641691 RepID=UPI000B86E79C
MDNHRRHLSPVYRLLWKRASTPVIDQLANEGVRFTNAFSKGTGCSRSRSPIITGVSTSRMSGIRCPKPIGSGRTTSRCPPSIMFPLKCASILHGSTTPSN